jgi:hypothetical protein
VNQSPQELELTTRKLVRKFHVRSAGVMSFLPLQYLSDSACALLSLPQCHTLCLPPAFCSMFCSSHRFASQGDFKRMAETGLFENDSLWSIIMGIRMALFPDVQARVVEHVFLALPC